MDEVRDATRRTRLATVGVGFIGYGYVRQKQVDAALDDRAAILFAACGVLLGLATIILVVAGT